VRVRFWGTRGSLATPGPETVRYGGETSCVEVRCATPEHVLILDAGSGLRRLGDAVDGQVQRIDMLLSHLHLDHIIGLGFFAPLFRSDVSVTVWGPASGATPLIERLGRYLSPPLFPVRLREVDARISLREVPEGPFECGPFEVTADPVIHRDPALGYRIRDESAVLAYLPDHEPALGGPTFPRDPEWTSGLTLAADADLLIHDAQYTDDEYAKRIGWGHSAVAHAVEFAELAGVRRLALFHHDPAHSDAVVDDMLDEARSLSRGADVVAAAEGDELTVETG
jgi:phosphoribosyl 1,2-cyclic phosphodiesterase